MGLGVLLCGMTYLGTFGELRLGSGLEEVLGAVSSGSSIRGWSVGFSVCNILSKVKSFLQAADVLGMPFLCRCGIGLPRKVSIDSLGCIPNIKKCGVSQVV